MNQVDKAQLLEQTQKHISQVQRRIEVVLAQITSAMIKGKETLKNLARGGQAADQMVQVALNAYNKKREQELRLLSPSPYFVRCEVALDRKEKQVMYFAKFPLSEESIYSWVAPAAAIRFEKPGPVTYTRPGGTIAHGILTRRDQYMIVNGHVVFFATEAQDTPRELVYQEHFSTRKTGFVLPEIVEQMEKAQDTVIRAHHRGPFVISGPAGSGKTTLALHRVAYLVQAPDTAEYVQSNSIIVFVQDHGTKAYFSHLLPELGITDVAITTFTEWALDILGLTDIAPTSHQDSTSKIDDVYEWQKLQALHERQMPAWSRNPWNMLEKIYAHHFTPETSSLFAKQKAEGVLDRSDLTILLRAYANAKGGLDSEKEYIVERANGTAERKRKRFPLAYSLVIVDEFQNYLPEQLSLIRSTAQSESKAIIYVGDLAQQIRLGTIRDWSQIHEKIAPDRVVTLQKVYRNTCEILEYLRDLGYSVTIPEQVKHGPAVVENICASETDELSYLRRISLQANGGSVGILCLDASRAADIASAFASDAHVRVMSVPEAQGVEFDIVCVLGVQSNLFAVPTGMPQEFIEQKQRIHKDLLYVALTRAVNELHVLGSERLSNIVRTFKS